MSDFWKTSISQVRPNEILVRGYPIEELASRRSFGDIVYLLLTGELPVANEGRLVEAILVTCCEHSLASPSADAVRFVASSGVPLQTAVAAGVSSIGEVHGGAIEPCARLVKSAVERGQSARLLLEELKSQKRRMPGFGHALHTRDPCVPLLFKLAQQWDLFGPHSKFVGSIEAVTRDVFGKTLAANMDGAIAGLMCDMNIDPGLGKAFFIIGRAPGYVAHAHEQTTAERPFKAAEYDEITYTGPERRSVPLSPEIESEDRMAYGPAPVAAPPGAGPESGTRQLSMAEAINEAIRFEMRSNPEIILLGQDIGAYGGTFGVYKGLFDEFGPERVRDGPLCEAATAGFGIGLALAGHPTIVEIEFIDFITLVTDALVNQAAKMRYFFGGQVKVPLILRAPIVNRLGLGAQHSQSLEAWLMHVPGLRVVTPSNGADAKGLLLTALRDDNPTVFIEHVRLYATRGPVSEDDEPIPFGKLRVARAGSDVTIATYSGMVKPCLDAAEKLATEGIECEVLDLRTLAPLDREGLCESVRRTGRLIVAHEAVKTGGAGAEIAQSAVEGAFDYLQAPIVRVASKDLPIPTGTLQDAVYPHASDVEQAVRQVVQ